MNSNTDIIIVGLGNPGKKYSQNRHNFGWFMIDEITKQLILDESGNQYRTNGWVKASDGKSLVTSFNIAGQKIKLLKPLTFMNESGEAVATELNFYKMDSKHLWVIHDELDLPLGTVRLSFDASAAGHNGVKSIIDKLGFQNFWRVRLGIGQDPVMPAENFVLQNFSEAELKLVNKITSELAGNLLDKIKQPEPKPETITMD